MDAAMRNRIEAACRSLTRRALDPLHGLAGHAGGAGRTGAGAGRAAGPCAVLAARPARRRGIVDVGLHRHWLDPTIPFAMTLAAPAQGLLMTSATLRDAGDGDPEAAWAAAEARVGAPHLPSPAIRAAVASPFDYARADAGASW